jgi:integrase
VKGNTIETQNRTAFTKTAIVAVAKPAKGRRYVYDTKVEGLAVCVMASGAKTFYVYRWHQGRPVRILLGKFPVMSVEQAQKAARAKVGEMAEGRDPAAERRRQREEATLAELWESYLELHAKPRKRTWKDDERQYNKYMADLRRKRLSAITQTVVAKWHGAMAKDHGPIQANRCKALLATMYSKASKAVGYAGPNPCKDVENFAERSRERFLLPAEMAAFFNAVAAEGEPWTDFYMVALFTGARRGVVASMRWQEIDMANAVWHIPADKAKNKRPNVVALAPPVLAILNKRLESANGCEWVFPSDRIEGHIVDCRTSWNRVLAAMRTCPKCGEMAGGKPKQCPKCDAPVTFKQPKCPECGESVEAPENCPKCQHELPDPKSIDLHVHDLRRSLGSWQAALGASLAVIGKSLNHADLKSTQVYSRLQLDPVRESVDKATTAMIEASRPKVIEAEVTKP